jgi:hypothetical protein
MGNVLVNTFFNTLSYERASKVEKYILNVFGLQSKLIQVGMKKISSSGVF